MVLWKDLMLLINLITLLKKEKMSLEGKKWSKKDWFAQKVEKKIRRKKKINQKT